MKVYLSDLREIGYCIKGTQEFFLKHNMDWDEFKRFGIESEIFLATNDIMAIKLAEIAINRSLEDGR